MSIHITDDSRNIHPGDIFVAIDGGHNFAANAVNSGGAALAVVQNEIAELAPDKQRIVPDTRIAYLEYGAEIRNQFRGRIVAITGSAGKTTTKEMLVAALAPQCRVYATRGNFNNTIGVARTLCDMDLDADVAVIELGMSHAGEIESLVSYVRPDIAAIINIYPMHIEFFPDGLPGIARAKSEIFSTDPKIAVISAGANHADILIDAANRHAGKTILFDGENKECVLAIVGALGYDTERAAAAIADFSPLAGRGKMHQLMSAHGSYTLIDESYSGQPESMKRAIKKLDAMPGRKIAVIGKMSELGDHSVEMHKEIGRLLATTGIDIVIGICPETKDILAQLPANKQQFYFENNAGLADFLTNELLQGGDVVMIKGSHYGSKLFETAADLIGK